ncbi:hypothetical protein MCUN1_003601 [Malassezia cuniculi]|uniref:Tetratricopeptide repeat protein 1 n=1 Tax=Malassezia cuniculi TaxID=948313 RepID=A0AAF0EX10_9BASI|nr:hypothetical protein MCUN1_003601 [Malassezia cuniculi]
MFERLPEAQALKKEGNELFVKDRFAEAAAKYNDALVRLPTIELPENDQGETGEGASDAVNADDANNDDTAEPEEGEPQGVSLEEHLANEEAINLRTALHCNLAACYLKLEQYNDAVKASTLALSDDELNVKALHRRATAYEGLGKWTDLEKALKDYQRLAELDKEGYVPTAYGPELRASLERVPKMIQLVGEAEKNEMLGKLKGIGNSILGYFGLSTDNFKMTQQPGGGYSVNLEQ